MTSPLRQEIFTNSGLVILGLFDRDTQLYKGTDRSDAQLDLVVEHDDNNINNKINTNFMRRPMDKVLLTEMSNTERNSKVFREGDRYLYIVELLEEGELKRIRILQDIKTAEECAKDWITKEEI